ncbi:MAG TPA: transaldolase [Gemmatimonadaceae bacterium]|nr:transaldolase [Gemmatimonadaceae bacterium]
MPNRLQQLHAQGQSIWLDFIDRTILKNGELARRMRDDALTGVTSNPTIFEKALAEGSAYDEQLSSLSGEALEPAAVFEAVETDDVRAACDILRPVYDATEGQDGFVSIEVSPGVANDTAGTLVEARRLWKTVGRPNVMVKVPGTDSGAVAVRQLIAEGVNVNITLLFSLEAYGKVIVAYQNGLADRVKAGQPVQRVASVASFFVSRVDTEVDKRLDAKGPSVAHLKGKAAVANAKLAYGLFLERFAGPAWETLRGAGARVQRPLWASTSAKNPAYRDVMYVEDLIGPDTVNTMPPATIDAFRDHGEVARTVDRDLAGERRFIAELEAAGVSMQDVTKTLLVDGLASFQKSFDTLLGRLEHKTRVVAAR